jgi:hypothetical protein
MSIRVRRVNPYEMREAIVELFWKLQTWPYATREEYARSWDWRYASLSATPPAVWVAFDGETVVGHIAVFFRQLSLDGRTVRAGVPANLRLLPQYHNSMLGAMLSSSPWTLMRAGEIDLLLGYSNRIGHSLLVARGSNELGAMRPYVGVRQWAHVLSRRIPGGAALAPLARLAMRVRNLTRSRRPRASDGEHVVRTLSAAEVQAIDRAHWAPPVGLVASDSGEQLARRFLGNPFRELRVFGVAGRAGGRIDGFVVTEGTTRVSVLSCVVNEAQLSEVDAVELAVRAIPSAQSVVVLLLPQTELAEDFAAAGYFPRSVEEAGETASSTFWSAYWNPAHPLAHALAQIRRWKLWYAWSHH